MYCDLSEHATELLSSISKQKDKLLFEVLEENGIDYFDLTNLVNRGRFIKQEGKNYQIFNYDGRDLLMIYDPETTCDENYKFKVEVKYKKLY